MTSNEWFRSWVAIALTTVVGIVGMIGCWLTSVSIVDMLFSDWGPKGVIAQIYLITSCSLIIIFCAALLGMKTRKEKYASVTRYLHGISRSIRDTTTYISCYEAGEIQCDLLTFSETVKDKLEDVLDNIQSAFTSIMSTNCRASILCLYFINQEVYYYVLARDKKSRQSCLEIDNNRVENNQDALRENHQLLKLLGNNNRHLDYFSSDLISGKTYQSISFAAYDPGWPSRADWGPLRFLRRAARWPHPYLSTIACVIRCGPTEFVPNKKPIVLGFVTIDSESRNVFSERWDVPILFSVADALYHPMRKFLAIQNNPPQLGADSVRE